MSYLSRLVMDLVEVSGDAPSDYFLLSLHQQIIRHIGLVPYIDALCVAVQAKEADLEETVRECTFRRQSGVPISKEIVRRIDGITAEMQYYGCALVNLRELSDLLSAHPYLDGDFDG